ncbi:coiled-coil domain-containing protein 38 isoform X1 [Monodelphis domestica]|uniref:coiled-coil domain-containing protein 38 isoform X1 n=2 Tax=Monodelphis domestica TaxID=13616 RepID=UPI0024E1FF5B|nr:coiled-coil domain-containing protein 38 isoform X1 [Monodelphis domestica]XP_056654645.1 coiled-coil domain-containing protein 38 isoform X1 [Monodelphis domestica]
MASSLLPVKLTASKEEEEKLREIFLSPTEKSKKVRRESTMPYTYYLEDIFLFKQKEAKEKEKVKCLNRKRKVCEKTTFSSRMKNRSHLAEINIPIESAAREMGLDSTLILSFVDRGADSKKSIQEFIRDQRERFMLEYTLATKRKTIMQLQRSMEMKEQQLLNAEKKLQEDAYAFEEFLRENDQKSVDALKIAAQETISKLQMAAELKKANVEIHLVKSEIIKSEFLLREYLKYGYFLLKLSPKSWQEEQAAKRENLKAKEIVPTLPKLVSKESVKSIKKTKTDKESAKKGFGTLPPLDSASFVSKSQGSKEKIHTARKMSFMDDIGPTINLQQDFGASEGLFAFRRKKSLEDEKRGKRNAYDRRKPPSPNAASISSEESFDFSLDEIDYDMEPELYFKEPEELLRVLTELEEQNLTLVQYSQDVDETLEDVSKREKAIEDKVNSNIEILMEQKEILKSFCAREEEKAAELELRSRLFNFGEFNSEVQERLIDSLSKKVNQVYKVCIGEVDVANLNPVQKLVKVESRLVELSDLIETVPRDIIEVIEKAKQRERRQKMREEKLKEKQRSQEEKIRLALERAVSGPKKKTGRRLVFRSQPLADIKQEILFVDDTKSKLFEDQYFFS